MAAVRNISTHLPPLYISTATARATSAESPKCSMHGCSSTGMICPKRCVPGNRKTRPSMVVKKHIAAAGLTDRIHTATGDFFQDPLPKADAITMGMILHDWNLEKKMKLIRAVYEALPPGGAFIAIEALIDNARRENVFGLLMSLNMLIEFGDAFDYSAVDFEKWCREVGFKRFEVIHLAGPSSAAIAYK